MNTQMIRNQQPWNLLTQLQHDLSNAFESPLASLLAGDGSKIATGQWAPPVDIREEPNQFIVHADIPGVDPANIEVTMENGLLTMKGHRECASASEQAGYSRVERVYGSFYRRFSLPDTADQDSVQAECKQGVLTITITKKEKAKARKIEIRNKEKGKS